MFKRSTKITSLILAAASISTMAPAMAADVKKIDEKDGTIYNAFAYKDGKFYIDGDLEDKKEDAYYLSDGKYTDLDKIDSGDEAEAYGPKYVKISDGDYYVDLSTGKVTDDDIAEDAMDDIITTLRKKVKKDDPKDRYDNTEKMAKITKVPSPAFFEGSYYEASYEASQKAKDNKVNGGQDFTVYTDKDGKYIDADHNIGKIRVTTGDSVNVTLENTSDDKKGYRAEIEHKDTIAQDKDYIYRTAYLRIKDEKGNDVTKGVGFGAKEIPVNPVDATKGILVIQKISKAQASGDIDDAKYAKTVNTYFVTDEDGVLEDGVVSDRNFTVVDGKLIAYNFEGDKIIANTIELKSKNGYYYTDVKKEGKSDIENKEEHAYAIDANGELWILDSGNVKKWDNNEDFDKVYKVDGSMSELSVYDKNNLVVWDEEDEVYSIISGKAAKEETTTNTTVATTGWVQDATTGAWSYVKADGTKAMGWFQSPTSKLWYYMDVTGNMMSNGWIQDAGKWYFLDSTGAMKTGWLYTGGSWYYLASNGAMQTGWIQTGGKWYFLNNSGVMLANTTVQGYVLGADGAWVR